MKKNKLKRIIAPIIPVVLIAAYCIFVLSLKDRLPGNTFINGTDCSFMKYNEAADALTKNIPKRTVKMFNGEEEIGEIDVSDYASLSFRPETISAIAKNATVTDKLFYFVYRSSYDLEPEVIVSSEALNSLVKEFGGTIEPVNAYIKRNDEGIFEIVPEENGNSIDAYTAEDILTKTIEDNLPEADISNAFVKAGILSTDDRLVEKCNKLNNDFEELVIKFVYKNGASTKTTVLQDEELFAMYKTDENGVPYINDAEEYEIDSILAREFVEKIVPENYGESEQIGEEINAASKKTQKNTKNNKTEDAEKDYKLTAINRENKIQELVEWLVDSLSKHKSGNKQF